MHDSFTLTKTLHGRGGAPRGRASASALETPPGPVDDPAHAPAGLRFEKALPPADSLESVADDDEPESKQAPGHHSMVTDAQTSGQLPIHGANAEIRLLECRNSIHPKTIFSIDLRALACFRVLMGALATVDGLHRLSVAEAHYSDSGVLPQSRVPDGDRGPV